jgi:large subunit ribosomal protein L35
MDKQGEKSGQLPETSGKLVEIAIFGIPLPLDDFWSLVKLWALENPKDDTIMTKQKTHKSTRKRFRLSANGKAKHRKAGTSHLAISKSAKKIRQLRGTKVLEPQFEKAIQEALRGYSY